MPPRKIPCNIPWVLRKGFILLFLLLSLADLGDCDCRLDFAIKQSSVKLSLSRPLEAFSESLNIPEDVRRRIEDNSHQQPPRYRGFLTYTPTDGFSNQLISFSTATMFAWLTNRVLVIPPLLGHYEGPARGNCLKPSRGLTNQGDIKAAYSKVLKEKLQDGSSPYFSLSAILNLTLHQELVAMVDSKDLYSQPWASSLSVYEVPHDCCSCVDTVWLPYPLNVTGSPTTREGVTFRSIEKTLGDRPEDVISMGSVYLPHSHKAGAIFRWSFECFFKRLHRVLQTTPYVDTINRFGERIRDLEGEFTCVHIRVSDSYFQAAKKVALQSILKQLQPLAASSGPEGPRTPLLVISDVPLGDLPTGFMGALKKDFAVFTLRERYQGLMAVVSEELGFSLDLMHFEASACTYAGKFIRNPSSTFSRRITDLRDHLKG